MFLFIGNKSFRKIVREAVSQIEGEFQTIEQLKTRIKQLKEEATDAKREKRIEEGELKSLIKIKEEKLMIEATKKELELRRKRRHKEVRDGTMFLLA